MLHNYKLELFDKLNFLTDIAKKGLDSLPDEFVLFLTNELEIKSAALMKETGKNAFKIIGKTSSLDTSFQKDKTFNLKNYQEVTNAKTFNKHFVSDCSINIESSDVIQSIAFGFNESIGVLIIVHKIKPAAENLEQFHSAAKLAAHFLSLWNSSSNTSSNNNTSDNFYEILNTGFTELKKLINSINGLISLLNEDYTDEAIIKYGEEIKQNTSLLIETINDLKNISELQNGKNILLSDEFPLKNFLSDLLNNFKFNINKTVDISKDFTTERNITYNKSALKQIMEVLLNVSAAVSTNNKILVSSKDISENEIGISVATEIQNFDSNKLKVLTNPFAINNIIKSKSESVSGLSLTFIDKLCNVLNSNFNVTADGNKITFAITIQSGTVEEVPMQTGRKQVDNSSQNKILIIESDEASSTLLEKYLSKWEYETEFVDNGDVALRLLATNKYVAVILNVEQQNDNSLELLQKIKNNKATHNTPVIVFSVEPESEKVYLMGAVEYLVKPINYNNLVEILTSYKLRRNSNVLCVDDDQPTLKLVEQAIQTAGFNVISEYRSELVMDLIANKDIDLAIVDLDMPKLNGFELIKQIKSVDRFAKLPIIIYTGKEDYQEDLEKIDGMFVELLDKKSTSFNELEKTISDMIKSYESPANIGEQADTNIEGPKILMAEDYKHSQIIVTRLLKKNGFENITVVENGEEALRICEKEKIDLILMDMQMPVMNGFEATGEIRQLEGYEDTPIIALTAFAMKGDREKCLAAGATDYIAKPIDSKEFIEKVKYYSQAKVKN